LNKSSDESSDESSTYRGLLKYTIYFSKMQIDLLCLALRPDDEVIEAQPDFVW